MTDEAARQYIRAVEALYRRSLEAPLGETEKAHLAQLSARLFEHCYAELFPPVKPGRIIE